MAGSPVAVVAVSYDPVETLRRFSKAHHIEYPLLADVGSTVMERLGVVNVTMEHERAAYGRPMEDRHRGVPYPGTFFLDEDGIIVDKRFEQSHRIRPAGATLLSKLLGGDPTGPTAESASPGVRVAAWLDTDSVSANQSQAVHIRLEMDDGVHVYTEPVPDGFRKVAVIVSGDEHLRSEPVEVPAGKPFKVQGLSDEFFVLEGQVDLAVPFFLLHNRDTAGDPVRDVVLQVTVEYQACTDEECFMPERIVLELPLREVPNPGYESVDPAAISPLALRRILEQPRREPELLALVNAALEGVEVSSDRLERVLAGLASDGFIKRIGDGMWAPSSPD